MLRHLTDKELKELEFIKTVQAGANIKNVVNKTKSQQPKKIDPRILAAKKEGNGTK